MPARDRDSWTPRDPEPPPLPLPVLPPPPAPEALPALLARLGVMGICLTVAPGWCLAALAAGAWTHDDGQPVVPAAWVLGCGLPVALVLLGGAAVLGLPLWVAWETARVQVMDGWDRLDARRRGFRAILRRARAHTLRYGGPKTPRVQVRTETIYRNAAGTTERVEVATREIEDAPVIEGETVRAAAGDGPTRRLPAGPDRARAPQPHETDTRPLPGQALPAVDYTAAMRAIVEVGITQTPSQRACIGPKAQGFPFAPGERDAYNAARDTLLIYGVLRRTSASVELAHGIARDGDEVAAVHARVDAILAYPGPAAGEGNRI